MMMMQQQQDHLHSDDAKGKQRWNHNFFGTRVTYSSQQRTKTAPTTAAAAATAANGATTTTTTRNGWWNEKLDQALLLGACGATHTNTKDTVPSEDNCNHHTDSIAATAATTTTALPRTIMSNTTTRIAKGKRRCVTRTAHVHPDGRREVVVEENGVVILRKFYSATKKGGSDEDGMESARNGERTENCSEKISTQQQHDATNLKSGSSKRGIDKKVNRGNDDEEDSGDRGDFGGIQREDKFTFLGLFKSCLAPSCTCLPATTATSPTYAATAATATTTNFAN